MPPTKRKRGRPTLEQSEADPRSPANIIRAINYSGYDHGTQIKNILNDIDLIDDPSERVKARTALFNSIAPYTDHKKGSEDNHNHTLTIKVDPMFLPQKEKNITPHPIIEGELTS